MINLGTLGGLVSEAFSINEPGQITGYSDVPAKPTSQQHAFLYRDPNARHRRITAAVAQFVRLRR